MIATTARAVLIAALWLGAVPTAHAQATTNERPAALAALAERLELPLLDRAIAVFTAELRRVLPSAFVEQVGRSARLGPRWTGGNADFEQAVRQVEAALAIEERRAGPLVTIERRDLLTLVRLPWTIDDIAFLQRTAGTDLGREAQRAIDARAAQQAIATFARELGSRPGMESAVAAVRPAFDEIDGQARQQFADASLMLLAVRGADPDRANRLQRLIESVDAAPSAAIGRAVTERLSQRLLDAAASQLPNLLAIIAGFTQPVR